MGRTSPVPDRCPKGHNLTQPDAVYTRPSGQWECRKCMREWQTRWLVKRKKIEREKEYAEIQRPKSADGSGVRLTIPRKAVIAALRSAGNEVVDRKGGQATGLLIKKIKGHRTNPATINGVLRTMERDGIIERDTRGRRTYRIALTPQYRKEKAEVATAIAIEEDRLMPQPFLRPEDVRPDQEPAPLETPEPEVEPEPEPEPVADVVAIAQGIQRDVDDILSVEPEFTPIPSGVDYIELGQSVLGAAAKALAENDLLKAENEKINDVLRQVNVRLSAQERELAELRGLPTGGLSDDDAQALIDQAVVETEKAWQEKYDDLSKQLAAVNQRLGEANEIVGRQAKALQSYRQDEIRRTRGTQTFREAAGESAAALDKLMKSPPSNHG